MNLSRAGTTNVFPRLLDIDVTLLYFLRWLTDTLPQSQQTATYRERRAAMVEFVDLLSTNGFRSHPKDGPKHPMPRQI